MIWNVLGMKYNEKDREESCGGGMKYNEKDREESCGGAHVRERDAPRSSLVCECLPSYSSLW